MLVPVSLVHEKNLHTVLVFLMQQPRYITLRITERLEPLMAFVRDISRVRVLMMLSREEEGDALEIASKMADVAFEPCQRNAKLTIGIRLDVRRSRI